jgi:hypothetical protein
MPGDLRKPAGLNLHVSQSLEREDTFDTGDSIFTINRRGLNVGDDLMDQTFRFDGASSASEEAGSGSVKECVVCLSERRSTRVFPCSHASMCAACLEQLVVRTETPRCPLCREVITSWRAAGSSDRVAIRSKSSGYLRKPAGLSLHVSQSLEREDTFDIGDSTFRRDGIVINRRGLSVEDPDREGVKDDVHPEDLEHGKTLGRGCSSYVKKVTHRPSGRPLALKVINLYDKDRRHQLMEGYKSLYYADCPSLIKFHGAFFKDSAISLCLEFMDKGSLHDVVRDHGSIEEKILANITYQILWGLAYLNWENR